MILVSDACSVIRKTYIYMFILRMIKIIRKNGLCNQKLCLKFWQQQWQILYYIYVLSDLVSDVTKIEGFVWTYLLEIRFFNRQTRIVSSALDNFVSHVNNAETQLKANIFGLSRTEKTIWVWNFFSPLYS